VLFTRDLRVHDQAALSEAARVAETVIPLFVADDTLLAREGTAHRLRFLAAALADLRDSLRRRGADLVIRRGDPVAETLRLVGAHDATAVFIGGDASSYARHRERRLGRERVELRVENTVAAVPPGTLAPNGRNHYRVFTPYWRRWREEPLPAILDPPAQLTLPDGVAPGPLPFVHDSAGGETAGRGRLSDWLAHGVGDYDDRRDDLAADGSSRLSAHLHFGCLSATEVITRARAFGPAADPFVRQLCWRDFYLQLLAANPRLATEDLHPRRRDWNDDDAAFALWREGETGSAVVDATMRRLRAEGWIGNRARLIVAGYLTKTLGLDWRLGAAVFAELLVDADVANNVGNWQWVAGTGVDTRPNRGFNADRQAKRFDRDGAYVRRYLPDAYTSAA
jgi:deoxyribodipyrimidine photo-lyase